MKKFLLIGVASLTLAACADSYRTATSLKPSGTTFQQWLYEGYVDLSKSELDEVDYADSDHFADKAIAAAEGQDVAPDTLDSREIDAEFFDDLQSARFRVTSALAAGGASVAPADMATAQVMYDCWIQEQEENIQPDHIANCRAAFETAMAKVEAALNKPAPAPKPVAKPEPLAPFIIYFGFDDASLSDDGRKIAQQAADAAQKHGASRLLVSGHTDTSGDSKYNVNLAKKRAQAVVDALQSMGVNASVRSIVKGEGDPAVETADNVKEAQNRRVEIRVIK
ncbi:OmpA family protein [Kiloniella sp. b19]|uniref:OmpA family protein n=1 Tax=Kiloniella sp. GXU_MW_B19 TaxID=3141326 RepID=UPI0031CEA8D8